MVPYGTVLEAQRSTMARQWVERRRVLTVATVQLFSPYMTIIQFIWLDRGNTASMVWCRTVQFSKLNHGAPVGGAAASCHGPAFFTIYGNFSIHLARFGKPWQHYAVVGDSMMIIDQIDQIMMPGPGQQNFDN